MRVGEVLFSWTNIGVIVIKLIIIKADYYMLEFEKNCYSRLWKDEIDENIKLKAKMQTIQEKYETKNKIENFKCNK